MFYQFIQFLTRDLYSPVNKEELFNLRHAQARNVIERIFGVLKNRWDILNHPAQYNMNIQAKIPPGLAAVHNFIMDNDDTDIYHYLNLLDETINEEPQPAAYGDPGQGAIGREERERAAILRDQIATDMWNSYQEYIREHPEVLDNDFIPETD